MAGYRYVPLRNRHNEPLPLAALFVHITVEDWIHDDMKGDSVVMNSLLMCLLAYLSFFLQLLLTS